ncbi:hypothetical protein [Amycolatopsis sp. NPDC059657]|uniref:hypothetical protein n=1 Tax=Amycolatopsis sp. NPDC059657 TaxID=3346899 RepID=UPI00367355A1
MTDDEIPLPPEPAAQQDEQDSGNTPAPVASGRSRAQLDAMTAATWNQVKALNAKLKWLADKVKELESRAEDTAATLPPWLPFEPPAAAEDDPDSPESPLFTLVHFVEYYNSTYVGYPGTRANAIPDCWLEHPGLVAEVATLTYTWRAAHLGPKATARDAQHWHDRYRPAFAVRMATEWTHTHCLTQQHRNAPTPTKTDRYTLEWRAKQEQTEPSSTVATAGASAASSSASADADAQPEDGRTTP